jgi:hypothetical protein
MMLHSVSLIYPVTPTAADMAIANRFLNLFGETISCNQCKVHFANIYSIYKSTHPDYLNSRQNFALFVFRAHNTVNKRLDKPIPKTVSECLSTLKIATAQTSFPQFRNAYLSYLTRNWSRDHTGEGRIMYGNVKEMIQINNQYWSLRDEPIPELEEADVTISLDRNLRVTSSGSVSSVSVGFKNGRLRLR